MNYITIEEAAEKWNISIRRAQDLCRMGRIPGSQRWGKLWMIPSDAAKPADRRCKEAKEAAIYEHKGLIRKTPFLYMTDLYKTPGSADIAGEALADSPESQALFVAGMAYSRGDIDTVYEYARTFLTRHSGLYAVLSGGMLLGLCAMWKGDIAMYNRSRKYLFEAPCKNEVERDIVLLSIAVNELNIRLTDNFPEWFSIGCFDKLPHDAHPAAAVFYAKHLLVLAQEVALGNKSTEDVTGLGFMKLLPYVVEPLISRMVAERIIMAEIHLRLICAIAYKQYGDDKHAGEHLDKAIALALPDRLYAPLAEYRRQLGLFLDEHIMLADQEAAKRVKELYKQFNIGWTKLHNAITEKNVQVSLSLREREVARLAAFGLSNSEISKRLYISVNSVNSILTQVKNKTGAESRLELGLYI